MLSKSHDLHRRRRKPLEPFFSRLGVSRLEHMLADVVAKFNSRLEAFKGTDTVVRLDHAFTAFSGDVIRRICCEDKQDLLDDPNFAPQWCVVLTTSGLLPSAHLISGLSCFTNSLVRYLCSQVFLILFGKLPLHRRLGNDYQFAQYRRLYTKVFHPLGVS